MGSVVIELQRELLVTNCDVLSALRKAHLIAAKLNLMEFDNWIQSELNGYKCIEDEIPEYRSICGELKAWNPYSGWIPVLFEDGNVEQTICNRKLSDSISAIIELSEKSDSKSFQIKIPTEAARTIDKMSTASLPTNYIVKFSIHLLKEIIDKVKNCLLEWTLTLERQGIKGDDMIFNNTETDAAKAIPQQINNYYGTVINGDIEKSQLSTGDNNTISLQTDYLIPITDEIRKSLANENLSSEDLECADELIKDIESKIETKKKPTIIKVALNGLKDFLIGVGANVTADLIIAKMNGIF